MTLQVNVYTRDDAGKMVFHDPDDSSYELAGFESFRKTFYGGQTARSLGLRLLPSLDGGDIYAEEEDLMTLRDEATLMLHDIDSFTREAGHDSETLRYRIRNILTAVDRAQQIGGSVVIW